MIMPDDDLTCKPNQQGLTGFTALYDVSDDAELSTGVLVAAVVKGVVYLFQLDDTTDILNEESMPVMEGTVFEYLDEEPVEDEIDYYNITSCRFPTKEELEWYNSLKTV